jgi:hypothetical protein
MLRTTRVKLKIRYTPPGTPPSTEKKKLKLVLR